MKPDDQYIGQLITNQKLENRPNNKPLTQLRIDHKIGSLTDHCTILLTALKIRTTIQE